jgi:hypothetical protein
LHIPPANLSMHWVCAVMYVQPRRYQAAIIEPTFP